MKTDQYFDVDLNKCIFLKKKTIVDMGTLYSVCKQVYLLQLMIPQKGRTAQWKTHIQQITFTCMRL